MLTVETIGRIRREHFIKGKTIREIARDLKVSRNTVRKVLRSFEYERNPPQNTRELPGRSVMYLPMSPPVGDGCPLPQPSRRRAFDRSSRRSPRAIAHARLR